MKNNKNKIPLSGKNIYVDKKNRNVYYNKRTKQGFIINEQLESSFKTFSNRYIIGFVTFALVQFLVLENNVSPIIAIVAGLAAFALCEYKYRKVLNTCPMIQNFDFEKATKSIKDLKNVNKNVIILRSVLYLLLSVLLIANIFVSEAIKESAFTSGISLLISLIAAYVGISYLISVFKQK